MSTVHIIGLGRSAHGFKSDPLDTVFALAWDKEFRLQADTLFEMHPRSFFERRGEEYLEFLRESDTRIFMQLEDPEFRESWPYPIGEMELFLGRDYFGSSVAYMLAFAIFSTPKTIHLWGVDLDESIYDHQRPNLEWLIGFANASGIKVEIENVVWKTRYGWID
jgi:hypothetical protein